MVLRKTQPLNPPHSKGRGRILIQNEKKRQWNPLAASEVCSCWEGGLTFLCCPNLYSFTGSFCFSSDSSISPSLPLPSHYQQEPHAHTVLLHFLSNFRHRILKGKKILVLWSWTSLWPWVSLSKQLSFKVLPTVKQWKLVFSSASAILIPAAFTSKTCQAEEAAPSSSPSFPSLSSGSCRMADSSPQPFPGQMEQRQPVMSIGDPGFRESSQDAESRWEWSTYGWCLLQHSQLHNLSRFFPYKFCDFHPNWSKIRLCHALVFEMGECD